MTPKQHKDFGDMVRAVQTVILKMQEMIETIEKLETEIAELKSKAEPTQPDPIEKAEIS